MGAGWNQEREWTCSGADHPAINPRVGREPRGAGVQTDSPKTVKFHLCGHGRLSSRTFWGTFVRCQGPRISYGDPHRLDPDGWLVRSQTDIVLNESPAA